MQPYIMHLVIGAVPLYDYSIFSEKRDVSATLMLYLTKMYLQSGSTFWVFIIFLAPYLISVWCFLSVEETSLHLYTALVVVPSRLAVCINILFLFVSCFSIFPQHCVPHMTLKTIPFCVSKSKVTVLHWSLVLSVMTFGLPNFFFYMR